MDLYKCENHDYKQNQIQNDLGLKTALSLSVKMHSYKSPFDERRFLLEGRDYLFEYAKKTNEDVIDDDRRRFLKGLVIGISVVSIAGIVPEMIGYLSPPLPILKEYPDLLLVDSNAKPILSSDYTAIPVNSPVIALFNYPLSANPSFLLRLGDSNNNEVSVPATTVTIPLTGGTYKFPGGVGAKGGIVAYSAICQHLGCKPPEIHFYPPKYVNPSMLSNPTPNELTQAALSAAKAAGIPAMIHCDCHGSTYNPFKGAAVLTGLFTGIAV